MAASGQAVTQSVNLVQTSGITANPLAATANATTAAVFQPSSSTALQATPLLGSTSAAISTDMRVRLGPLNPAVVYGNGTSYSILAALAPTGGVLFPYTPTINFSQGVDYMNLQLVHSDTDYQAYTRTPSVKISVTGKFTVQNPSEGVYAVAVLHFLRAVSKSYFGETDAKTNNAGMPPPVLLFSGYGSYMFGNVGSGLRVILTNHSWSFDDTVDYIPITVGSSGGTAKLPALFTVQCDLLVVQTPQRMMKTFNFADFASGALMTSNQGWI